MAWNPTKRDDVDELVDKIQDLLNEVSDNAFARGLTTKFGGLVVYAYVPPTTVFSLPKFVETEFGKFKNLDELVDKELAEKILDKAVKNYALKLRRKMMFADFEATEEVLSPLQSAAGLPPVSWTEVRYEHEDERGRRGKRTYVHKEVRDGITTSRASKSDGTGRPHEWTHTKLKTAVTRAANAVRKIKKSAPTLSETADALNVKFAGKKSFTEDSLRMLLKAYAVDWREIKKRR